MHDIDGLLNKVYGQTNYMDSLSKVIGNILYIDIEMYKKRLNTIHTDLYVAVKCADELMLPDIREELIKGLYIRSNAIIMHKKKPSKKTSEKKKTRKPYEKVNEKYTPKKIVNSEWFNSVKNISRVGNDLLEKLKYDPKTDSDTNWKSAVECLNISSNQKDILTFYDVRITDYRIYAAIVLITKNLNEIINQLLLPVYDYKETIYKNWDKVSNAFKLCDDVSPDTIMNILSQFVVAKYRVEITGSNKYYMQLFGEMLEVDDGKEFDGTQFLKIVDSIDLNKFESTSTALKFITLAKPIMRKLADKDNNQTMEEIIEEVQVIFNESETKRNEVEDENADLFT